MHSCLGMLLVACRAPCCQGTVNVGEYDGRCDGPNVAGYGCDCDAIVSPVIAPPMKAIAKRLEHPSFTNEEFAVDRDLHSCRQIVGF
jgi:hypothetical protein